jgi:hypothetical protein
VTGSIKLDHHNRLTAERVFRHPTSHNIQWHDVDSLLDQMGETRETTHGSLEVTIDGEVSFLGGPRHRELTEEHVVGLRKILRKAGLSPEDVDGHGAIH